MRRTISRPIATVFPGVAFLGGGRTTGRTNGRTDGRTDGLISDGRGAEGEDRWFGLRFMEEKREKSSLEFSVEEKVNEKVKGGVEAKRENAEGEDYVAAKFAEDEVAVIRDVSNPIGVGWWGWWWSGWCWW